MIMPRVNIDKRTDWTKFEASIIDEILTDNNTLKTNRPRKSGDGDYVWRMLAFQISPLSVHHCMPICAPYYLDLPYREMAIRAKELDKLVDKLADTVPASEHYGTVRWWCHAFYGE